MPMWLKWGKFYTRWAFRTLSIWIVEAQLLCGVMAATELGQVAIPPLAWFFCTNDGDIMCIL